MATIVKTDSCKAARELAQLRINFGIYRAKFVISNSPAFLAFEPELC